MDVVLPQLWMKLKQVDVFDCTLLYVGSEVEKNR
jgi:hypothetical protein